MIFLFNAFNHNETGRRTLEDPITITMHQLRALGHRAEWSNDHAIVGADTVTVLVEGFTEDSIGRIAEAHARGARFLIVATEEPTPKGFNHGVVPEMVARQAIFPAAARYADAILALVPGTEGWYGQFAPAAHVELGYAPSLVRRIPSEPDHLFGFFGALTPRRRRILERLGRMVARANAIRVMPNFDTQERRDTEMSRARVILQIRAHDAMGLVSSSRCNTALHLGRPVVAEPHELSKPWDEVVHFSRSAEAFFTDAIVMAGAWRGVYAGQFDRFRRLFSAEACIGAALARVGLAAERRVAA